MKCLIKHYQSVDGLWFSAFQHLFSTEQISTFVSYLMMHLNVASLVFQALAEQLGLNGSDRSDMNQLFLSSV